MTTDNAVSALVARAQAGDRAAFDELVRLYGGRLNARVRSRMSERLRAKIEAEDTVQETFAVAFQSIRKFQWRGEESFYRWLSSIAEHLLWSSSQKKAWEEIRLVADVVARDLSPSKNVRREERLDRLEKALAGLSDEHRTVLRLVRIEGLKVAEIAERLNRSPDAVWKLLARALVRLKEAFGDTESFHLPYRTLRERGSGGDE